MNATPTGTSRILGNVPYGFEDRESFAGRSRETHAFSERLRLRPLTVVSAASGSGKTSLLMAGVYPRLLEKRLTSRAALIEAAESGAEPPQLSVLPLVLRDWATGYQHFAQSLYAELDGQIRTKHEDIRAVSAELEASSQSLNSVAAEKLALDAVARILDGLNAREAPMDRLLAALDEFVGPVAIVLDQLEEVLRDPSQRAEVVAVLRRLAACPARSIHLMLSFRSDLPADAMRALQLRLNIGADEVLDLRPLDTAEAERVFCDAVDPMRAEPELTRGVVRAVSALSNGTYVLQPELSTACWYLKTQSDGLAVLSSKLDEYEAETVASSFLAGTEAFESARRAAKARAQIIAVSYEAWIDDALRGADVDEALRRLLVPMLTDMAPALVDEADAEVPVKVRVKVDRLRSAAFLDQLTRRGVGRLATWAPVGQNSRAGQAELTVDAEDQRRVHERAFETLLACLVKKRVLKPSGATDARRYELVHDSSGSALLAWAERQLLSVSYRMDSVQQGVTWDWAPEEIRAEEGSPPLADSTGLSAFECFISDSGRLENARVAWLSCIVGRADADCLAGGEGLTAESTVRSGARARGRTFVGTVSEGTAARVRFTSSSFKRTVFQNCDLRGITFELCDLSDVVFQGCSFDGVTFDRCIMVGAEFRAFSDQAPSPSRLRGVDFLDCALRGSLFDGCLLFKLRLLAREPRAGYDGEKVFCCGTEAESNAFYAIVRKCEIGGSFLAGTEDDESTRIFSWVGGAFRECDFRTPIVLRHVEFRVSSVENCTFFDGSNFQMQDCDGTGMIFLERGKTQAEAHLWAIQAIRTNLTGAVFFGPELNLSVVGEQGCEFPVTMCRGMVVRDAVLQSAAFENCDLMGLTVERVRYLNFGFVRCNLDRSGFYTVERMASAGLIEVDSCRRNAWQCEPATLEGEFAEFGEPMPSNTNVKSFGERRMG